MDSNSAKTLASFLQTSCRAVRVHQLYGAGDDAHDPCGHQDDNEDNAVAFGDKSRSNKLVDSQERDCGDSDFDLIEEESVDNACVRIVHDPQADLGHTSAVPVDMFEDEGEFDVANGDVLLDDDEDATDVAGDIEEDLGVDADDGSFPFPIDRGVECKLVTRVTSTKHMQQIVGDCYLK
ncbi:hypothetical protein CSKR_202509 [Clonorchis sinensis]|uniref:Uncharacterized protein n=1 Tax=Clonorchis sinensis TaxID=79923 RepID=A0A8T1MWZ5_CLOSI|nr:hypothetical protein CSKR_202509 [Clonorchis sinensis]